MSTVWIPQVLRAAAGGAKQIELDGATVGDVVRALAEAHPSVGAQLFGPDGDLHRFVNVYVNGQDVRYLDGLATPVAERDEVRILPAMAGGSRRGHAEVVRVDGLGCCTCTGRVPDGFCASTPQRRGGSSA